MASNGKSKKNLTPRQRRAVVAMLSARNPREAAQQAEIGERTLYRWLAEDQEFNVAIRHAEGELLLQATRRLLSLQQSSIDTLVAIRDDEETPATVRRGAARDLLDFGQKFMELRDIEQRLSELEARMEDVETTG